MDKRVYHFGYERFSWKGLKLFHNDKFLVELIPHEVYENNYYLKFIWREEKTPEFFSLRYAQDNSKRIALYRLNYDMWQPLLAASLVR